MSSGERPRWMTKVWPLTDDLIQIGGNVGFTWTAQSAIYYSILGPGYKGQVAADRHEAAMVDELGRLRGHLTNALSKVDAMLKELEGRDPLEAQVKRQRTSYNLTGATSSHEGQPLTCEESGVTAAETNATDEWEGARGLFFQDYPRRLVISCAWPLYIQETRHLLLLWCSGDSPSPVAHARVANPAHCITSWVGSSSLAGVFCIVHPL